jgi:hypothetical protein
MAPLMETSLTSMKAAFPTALEPIQGIPTLASLINLMLHMCCCAQTHKMPASTRMNMLFRAASPGLYSFFTTETYPASFFPFPTEVDAVLDFSGCTTNNKHEILKSTHALARKRRADIITMNAVLLDVFLAQLPKLIRKTYEPICMKQPNTVFLHMFDWFIGKYGKMRTKDGKENQQWVAADWHPSDGFEPLATHLFIGALYASAACDPMEERNIIDIGLRVIKRCGMYSEEYKGWIARKNKLPPVTKMVETFKNYWSKAITLINQMASPAIQHNYGMMAMNNNTTGAFYGESIANFGAAYAATQETMKGQATSLALIQDQLANLQQFCMALGQQPSNNIYSPAQQQHPFNSGRSRCNREGGRGGSGYFVLQQPTNHGFGGGAPGGRTARPPMPYKQYENWHYCHTHGRDVDNTHTSATCARPGPRHNPNATRNNTMGGSSAGLHKPILPLAASRTASNLRPQAQQQQQQRLPVSYFLMQAMQAPAWQQAAPPVGHSRMPPTGYNGGQRLIMPNHHGPNMMNFVGQYPPAASAMQPGQQPMV